MVSIEPWDKNIYGELDVKVRDQQSKPSHMV